MSPFRSEKQRRFMFLKHSDVAKRWSKEYGSKIVKSKKTNKKKKKNGRVDKRKKK